ncbi:MAG: DUF2807 domain-containing protein [Bacteroidetes bacterium]|nr:DUF2807 domain-containing protein [Bacteroidota bacterium]
MKIKIILNTIILIALFSCNNANSEIIKQERNVDQFSKIDLSIAAHVYLKQGNEQSIIIEADDDIINEIKTVVNNNTLVIKIEKWMLHYKNVNVYITTPNVDGLNVSGSGKIEALTPLNTSTLQLDVSGSGKIFITELNATNVSADVSGSGRINLKGKSELNKLSFDISGSGKITCTEQTKHVTGSISGSGTGNVYATKKLDIDISGSGKVYYKGNPLINCDISGSGKILENK